MADRSPPESAGAETHTLGRGFAGQLALGQSSLDRRADARTVGWSAFEGARRAVVLLDGDSHAAVQRVGDHLRLVVQEPDPASVKDADFLLGVDPEGVALGARVVSRDDPAVPGGAEWVGLRQGGLAMSALDREVLAEAVALTNWHRTHTHCPRCGSPTSIAGLGWWRTCPRDGTEHYPRTDPAVIALLIDPAENVLLGRQTRWPAHAFSTLAGFVEPGESLEAAVVREIAEEVGLRPAATYYLGSQPWPFPASLMLGFHAHVDVVRPEPVVDGVEIAEARWLSRAQLASAGAAGEVRLPGRLSIAHHLIARWWGQPLPPEWCRW